jgi:hypothetical protein
MLVKFDEDEKNSNDSLQQPINIEELSTKAGKIEAEIEKEKFTPTEEELELLEKELIRVNEEKFGSLVENQVEPVEESGIKRLSYTRRDA